MDYRELWKEENESVLERYELSLERIRQIKDEQAVTEPFRDYFAGVSGFINISPVATLPLTILKSSPFACSKLDS